MTRDVTPILKGEPVGAARTRRKNAAKAKKAAAERDAALYRASYRCEFEDSDGRCMERRNLHCHHIKRRSQGGSDDASNLLVVCQRCHDHIHRFPTESRKRGWLA